MRQAYMLTDEVTVVGRVEWLTDKEYEAECEWLWESGYYSIYSIIPL